MQPDAIPRSTVFWYFFLAHLLAAALAPIQDCDEVFNYWEASHYLNHGYGFQTWEYSPVYAIRSWAYAGLHASLIAPFKIIMPMIFGTTAKSAEFFFLRTALAIVCSLAESRFFSVVTKVIHPRIALFFMLIMMTSAGMFHASTAYLPSSFAMYTTMMGAASFMDWQKDHAHLPSGIMWFSLGAVLGWPFAGALILPYMALEAFEACRNQTITSFIRATSLGGLRALLIVFWQSGIDIRLYDKVLSVPWNIVAYNVFGGSSKGPDIYGTETWHWYIQNLLINYHGWFLLALVSPVAIVIAQNPSWFNIRPVSKLFTGTLLTYTFPMFLWLAIFTLQPHKEERFMYPIYPLIAFNAAITFHFALQVIGNPPQKGLLARPLWILTKVPASLKLIITIGTLIGLIFISTLRTAGMVSGYSAPLKVYSPLEQIAQPGDTVCLGKEWYRFPSSYFLPQRVKAKFIKSAFSGLLPGEFNEIQDGRSGYVGARTIPTGMNDENVEDLGKYTDISKCNFVVDSYFPSSEPSDLEPNYVHDTKTWEQVKCEPFLDNGATSLIGRLIWTPPIDIPPFNKFKREWGEYCLLKRKV
ncbi:mannosyl transferase [Microthyrium microscopicum]|uniref:Mannosyltransferase n=1 Tax=Microthyrium microscopicum TaxID=703497 RepID=A0A6A6UIR3_9PEZI|nr:mannosyl transferase [Microthyrium microscopicum]